MHRHSMQMQPDLLSRSSFARILRSRVRVYWGHLVLVPCCSLTNERHHSTHWIALQQWLTRRAHGTILLYCILQGVMMG